MTDLERRGLRPGINRHPTFDTRRCVYWSLAAALVLAAVVRLVFLGHDSFSHDEAARVNYAWSCPFDRIRWLPPLQYVLLWTVRHTLGGSEFAMRLPSAVAGIACVVALFLITRKYVDPWSGVCVAAVAAVHAELVGYSRLVKEFSIDALAAVAITWAGIHVCRDLSAPRLRVFLICGVLGLGLSYTGPLVIAAWMIVLVWISIKRPAGRRRALVRLSVVAMILSVAVGLWYLWLSGAVDRPGASREYGVLRGAWPADYGALTLVRWFFAQGYGALRFTLGIVPLYAPIDTLIGAYELLLMAVAVTTLWRRLPRLCAATAVLLVLTVAVGALKLWPFGQLHTMMFLVPLVCLAVGCGLRQMAAVPGRPVVTALLVLVCVVNPGARAVKNTVFFPSETEHVRPVLEYVERHGQPGDGIFAYYATYWAVRHYWKRDDIETLLEPTDDRGNLAAFADRFDGFLSKHRRVWFVFTHNYKNEREEWLAHLKECYDLADEYEIADASVYLFTARSVLQRRPSREMEAS